MWLPSRSRLSLAGSLKLLELYQELASKPIGCYSKAAARRGSGSVARALPWRSVYV